MNNNITGMYFLNSNNEFYVAGEQWQITKREGGRKYLFNNNKGKYISGIFRMKQFADEVYSFDYQCNYYFLSFDDRHVYIQYVDSK